MDKRKSLLNVIVSVAFKSVTIVLVIIVKRFLIQFCGNEANGLNSLYLSIIGILSVAELGVGSAITFCMYKPIVEGDNDKVSALYHLFRRIYMLVGGMILIGGFAIAPFVQYIAKDYAELNIDFGLTFVLMLFSCVITYLYGAKTALINAYKNNYITTAITSGGLIFQYFLQITVLLVTHSFSWYLVCRSIAALAQWCATEIVVRKKYREIVLHYEKVDKSTGKELTRSIRAMFMHKIGSLLVNTVDSVVISAFIGVVALGEYSNYTMILSSMEGIIALIFTSLTSIFGHVYVEDRKLAEKYCAAFHLINFIVGTVFFLGYYAVVDNLIAILFAKELVVARSISAVIAINGFVQFMRRNALLFRDATGTFYNDRWKPLLEGTANIVLSILLVKKIGVVGVIVATILTNLLICHIIEPYVLYRNAFFASPKEYYFQNYGMILVFLGALGVLDKCTRDCHSELAELLINGGISVGISAVVCITVALVGKKRRIDVEKDKEQKNAASD